MTVTVTVDGSGSRPAGDDATDLISRYQDHVERKVATSRATQEVYEQLLSRVASGDLDPRALDRGLNSFLQLNGAEYASGIANLSMRFLAGVLEATSRDASELFDGVATVARDSVPEAPELDPTDWADWVPQLVAFAEQTRVAQTRALRDVMERVASGELDPETVERIVLERSTQQVPATVTRLAGLYVEMLTGLDEANARFGMDYLRTVIRRAQRPDSIDLRGAIGESVDVRLVVANDEPADATMRCAISDVRREDGIDPAFDPEATFTPAHFDLAPHAEVQVVCSLLLTDAFAPDAIYVGELRVLTGTATVLEIPLRIRATRPSIAS